MSGKDELVLKNIAKGTTDPRVEFISQVHTNLDQTSILKSRLSISISTKLKILTKPSFIILTKIQLCNLNQTSAAKY